MLNNNSSLSLLIALIKDMDVGKYTVCHFLLKDCTYTISSLRL